MENLLKLTVERSIRYLGRLPEGRVFPSSAAIASLSNKRIFEAEKET